MAMVNLVHEVLDVELVDWRNEKLGRVDGLTLELRDGEPPRVGAILVGGTVIAERFGHRAIRWATLIREWWGGGAPSPTVIPFSAVRTIADTIQVELDAESQPAMRWEHWLRERIICRIPGAGGRKQPNA
ncbi:MAG: hypothetical protein JWO05_3782 [Gemmatimonadetes bacterium]|nr:hypothetical protein [Gemmatimonadota bacterium]